MELLSGIKSASLCRSIGRIREQLRNLDKLQIRLLQLLWFASNQPKHEVWAGPLASPDPRVATGTDEYKQIRQFWLKHLLRFSDPATVEPALQIGIDETNKAAVFQGDLYRLASLGITSVDPVAGRPSTAGDSFQTFLSPKRPDPFPPGRRISASYFLRSP